MQPTKLGLPRGSIFPLVYVPCRRARKRTGLTKSTAGPLRIAEGEAQAPVQLRQALHATPTRAQCTYSDAGSARGYINGVANSATLQAASPAHCRPPRDVLGTDGGERWATPSHTSVLSRPAYAAMLKPPPPVVVQAGSTLWLSYAIMTSTMIFRLPQLIKVCRAKSVAGLNPLSFEVEMYGSALCVLNGFRRGLPVDLWGEHIMNGTQSVLLVAMIYLYEGGPIDLGTIRRCLHALGIAALYATVSPATPTGTRNPSVPDHL